MRRGLTWASLLVWWSIGAAPACTGSVSGDGDGDIDADTPGGTCESVECRDGLRCVDTALGPQCRPDQGTDADVDADGPDADADGHADPDAGAGADADAESPCDGVPRNACGGCSPLPHVPGSACCDGHSAWRCDGVDAVECEAGARAQVDECHSACACCPGVTGVDCGSGECLVDPASPSTLCSRCHPCWATCEADGTLARDAWCVACGSCRSDCGSSYRSGC